MLEVELKFRLVDLSAFKELLLSLGAVEISDSTQEDVYFDHPLLKFQKNDKALRLRKTGANSTETYGLALKGPNLDAKAKDPSHSREEFEALLSDVASGIQMIAILENCGFQEAGRVSKKRTRMSLDWNGDPISVFLDDVETLGWFVELELLTELDAVSDAGCETQLESDKAKLLSLASRLGLSDRIDETYLDLILAQR